MSVATTISDLPSLAAIARLLGGEVAGNHVLCPGPGHSRLDRSLSVLIAPDAPEGFLVHSFAGDGPLACRDHVRERLGLERRALRRSHGPRHVAIASAHAERDRERTIAHRRRVAQSLWARSLEGRGSPAERYLKSRGISLERWPATLRFLPASPPNHLWPTMVAAYGMPREPEPGTLAIAASDVVAVQLTYLKHDGSGKAPIDPAKRSIGRGHAMPIVLAPASDSLGLVIAEGAEDALSLHIATGLAAWASGGAERMPAIADGVPDYIEIVTIAADDDDAGRKGAAALCGALRSRNITVRVLTGIGGRDG